MAKGQKRKKGRRRGAAARANNDVDAHIATLGVETIAAYKAWCKAHGFTAALNKTWQERRQERAAHEKDLQAREAEDALQAHIAALGLPTVEAYQAWCRQQGLGDSMHKSPAQRQKERKLAGRLQGDQALTKVRKHTRRVGEAVAAIWAGSLAEDELRTDVLRLAFRAFASLAGPPRDRLRDLYLLVEKKAKPLLDARPALMRLGRAEGNSYVEALGALARHRWFRDPADWKPESRNARRQFASLARFLLARYEVPACLDSAWFIGCDAAAQRQQGWFVHVGQGHNIRTADLPLALSKRMAHVFSRAPGDLVAEEALRWAQVVGQDGSEELAAAVLATDLGRSFVHEDFWRTVVLFFVENPMLDPDMVGPIVDYVQHQRFVPREVARADGTIAEAEPPQPHYTMKGRGAVKLLHQVELWHERLARDNRQPGGSWAPSEVGGFEWQDEEDEGLRWTIRELTSQRELKLEGRAMGHCVASYVPNCRRGSKSVWSMQATDERGRSTRVVTIAMHNPSRRVVEVRGRHNALPNSERKNVHKGALERPYRELLARSGKVVRRWLEAEGLERTKRAY